MQIKKIIAAFLGLAAVFALGYGVGRKVCKNKAKTALNNIVINKHGSSSVDCRDVRLDPREYLKRLVLESHIIKGSIYSKNGYKSSDTLHFLNKLFKLDASRNVHSAALVRHRPDLEKLLSPKGSRLIVDEVLLESSTNLWINGYFIRPAFISKDKKSPCVICIPGHGCVEDIIGIPLSKFEKSSSFGYQKQFALRLAMRGYPVFAFEQIGFGKRQLAENFEDKPRETSCNKIGKLLLASNSSLLSVRISDAKRVIDYVQSRTEIDSGKIALAGISAGGTTAILTGALDSRVAVVVVSGSLVSMKMGFLAHEHCLCNYVPGLLEISDIPKIASLICPRSLLVEHGIYDDTNSILDFRDASKYVAAEYSKSGHPSNYFAEEFSGTHVFNGDLIFEKLVSILPPLL